jgi:hypothetical protein
MVEETTTIYIMGKIVYNNRFCETSVANIVSAFSIGAIYFFMSAVSSQSG